MSKIADFCGETLPPPLMSAQNLLTLDFVLRGSSARAGDKQNAEDYGFIVEYRFLSGLGSFPSEAVIAPNTSKPKYEQSLFVSAV